MKTKITRFSDQVWDLFTEVPGWPDAPRNWRVRRALPLVVPFVAVLALVGWNTIVRNPRLVAERSAHQSLTALEDEIASLRMTSSDQAAAELTSRAETAQLQLLKEPQQAASVVTSLKKGVESHRWKGEFHVGELVVDDTQPDAAARQVSAVPVRVKLTSVSGNSQAFYDLLAVLKQLSAMGKRIDLTRLAIRADEQGRYAAELNLRLACLVPHEKTP